MFVCNVKVNKKKLAKIIIFITIILTLSNAIFAIYKIFSSAPNEDTSNKIQSITEIKSSDYTYFLKDCHENIENYVGKRFTITGYIYRMPDFNENQFVLSRTMIINEAGNSAVVVGILSEYNDIKKFQDGDWINVTGTIQKGYYKGEMPLLEIDEIARCNLPEDGEFVYPPLSTMPSSPPPSQNNL